LDDNLIKLVTILTSVFGIYLGIALDASPSILYKCCICCIVSSNLFLSVCMIFYWSLNSNVGYCHGVLSYMCLMNQVNFHRGYAMVTVFCLLLLVLVGGVA